ncbi:hypothetical protein [Pareuzebyella sediminis]|uniref:hypothetical protein n=1 Tax=Pareuzebyella sediminis TaxID=2607998 RepID=UPI0018E14DA1|nr:hypothetical protein [Pareuzebyella sediminis]
MTPKIFGIAAALVRSRKYTLVLVGAQFAYLGYKYFREKRKESKKGTLKKA